MRLLPLYFLLTTTLLAQDKVYLKDGTIIEGAIVFIKDNIVRIEDTTGKRKTIKKRKIDRLIENVKYHKNEGKYFFLDSDIYKKATLSIDTVIYRTRKISWREAGSPITIHSKWLVGKLISGNVSLYVGFTRVQNYRVARYFLHREGEEEMQSITYYKKGFRKRMSKYFKNCQKLSEKIKNKQYTYDDIFMILEHYNTNSCK